VILYGVLVAQSEVDSIDARLAVCRSSPMACMVGEQLNLEIRRMQIEGVPAVDYGVGAAVLALGAIAVPIGVWLLLDAPSDDAIREHAHASLRIAPGGLVLDGTF
jgi:hypothetical protein